MYVTFEGFCYTKPVTLLDIARRNVINLVFQRFMRHPVNKEYEFLNWCHSFLNIIFQIWFFLDVFYVSRDGWKNQDPNKLKKHYKEPLMLCLWRYVSITNCRSSRWYVVKGVPIYRTHVTLLVFKKNDLPPAVWLCPYVDPNACQRVEEYQHDKKGLKKHENIRDHNCLCCKIKLGFGH